MTAVLRSLSARVLIALIIGLGIGAVVQGSDRVISPGVVAGIEAVGGLWLNTLQMTVIPLVFSLVVVGIAAASDAAATGRLAARAVALFVGLVAAAAALTLLIIPLVLALWPVAPQAAQALITGAGGASAEGLAAAAEGGGFAQWLKSLAPANPVRAAAENAVLPLVMFAAFFGFAATRLPADQRALIVNVFEAVAQIMIIIVRWVLLAAPIGVFALALVLGLRSGFGSAPALIHYIVLVSGACIVTVLASYPLAALGGGVPIARFARALVPVQAVAFSTQSSLGTLPVMVERAQDFLGIPERVAGLVLPLSVAIFRITSPVANLSVALFIAHVFGLEPTFGQMAAAGVVALAVSIGTVGLPGQVSFFTSMAPICLALGVPLELLPLLLAVEVIPDIFRTIGNVSADMAVTVVLDDSEPEEGATGAA
ncbi:cation:dicarboxylase symporter family transporter [Brevundimonas sp.]|uniref:dicarboxylate/amino acid:cation symporter n=1 Tax=Brevundimonas sp. TaxID=1871086 RepID=UPI001DEE8027|nr:cation:dicarboxylase symporter family transporter [Brevundimonas sp.]MBA4000616.1 dicarboxylate/amino acid:cation symporter [Brevundimonas sp.]